MLKSEFYSGSLTMEDGQITPIARGLCYPIPSGYDQWGFHEQTDERWEYSFCIIDDFGTAVPEADEVWYLEYPYWDSGFKETVYPVIH